MFSPIVFDFGELYSIFIASIVGVHITLSCNVQRMIKLAINALVCIGNIAVDYYWEKQTNLALVPENTVFIHYDKPNKTDYRMYD